MEHADIKKFIVEKGYRTFAALKANFAQEDEEILIMNLNFLVSKHSIRKAIYQSPDGPDDFYYIPKE